MTTLTLADAVDLASWANRLDAQSRVPQVLRRLVHATAQRILRIGFPAGEGVQTGGWDGILQAERGNAFVPDGMSAWEMSANRDIKRKADSDYRKRLRNPLGIDPGKSTFIFVTPRKWAAKSGWIAAKRSDGVWFDVRAYDAEDLEQWLEVAPAVHFWLSIMLGKHPDGAMDLESFWQDWSETTRPAMAPPLLLAGRSDAGEEVLKRLQGTPQPFVVRAESRQEALAVVAARLSQLSPEERVPFFSRAVVVQTPAAWNRLSVPGESLILLPTFDSSGAVARAARHGHRVLVPLGAADPASDSVIDVPPVARHEFEKSLMSEGIGEERARELACVAHRSMMTLRRTLAVVPQLQQPNWAAPSEGRGLLPAMFAGTWDGSYDGDRQALSDLAREPYPEFLDVLLRWSSETDPPARRTCDAWYLVSKRDAWALLARYLDRADLDRFSAVATKVLSITDPLFDLPVEERWMARARGQVPRYSSALRKGLADSLAMLGAAQDASGMLGFSPGEYSTRTVTEILTRANADWRIWASLSGVLPLLAEAAPDAFLAAVEHGVGGAEPVLQKLFIDRDPLFSSSPHTGLLWALETLAWSPDYLAPSALVLARLIQLDPGGRLSNRPDASLREVFVPWLPQTAAELNERLGVLDMLRQRVPEVAWELMNKLVSDHGGADYHPTPQWRDWAPESQRRVPNAEWFKSGREIAARMIEDAGQEPNRWCDLVTTLPRLPPDLAKRVIDGLGGLEFPDLGRAMVADGLKSLISRHRSFPDSGWAMGEERLVGLERLFRRLESTDLVARTIPLFAQHPALLEGKEQDWEAYQVSIEATQRDGAQSVYAAHGASGILMLADGAEEPSHVGFAAGQAGLLADEEDDTLRECLSAAKAQRSQFVRGFVTGRIAAGGVQWAEDKLASAGKNWTPRQRAELLTCLRPDAKTWDLARAEGVETYDEYWDMVQAWMVDPPDVERGAEELLSHARPYSAIHLLYSAMARNAKPSPELVTRALESAMTMERPQDAPHGSFGYHVSELLRLVEDSGQVDAARAARIEWGYLGLLGQYDRPPELLHRELARDPAFFAEVLGLLFRGDNDELREPTPANRERASRAFHLLESWRTLPGSTTTGTVDADALTAWVSEARRALAAAGRRAIGDERIGQVLSGSPVGDDGAWPHPSVRRLIEDLESDDLERGIVVGIVNGRGVVSKKLFEGGAQERVLAERYDSLAAIVKDQWPRTARLLRRLADGYRAEAAREDEHATRDEEIGL